MRHLILLSAAFIFLVLASSCTPEAPVNNPEWTQYRRDEASSGFQLVRSDIAWRPQWKTYIGGTAYSSPVIGANGTIYIGTTEGRLVALNPNGTTLWSLLVNDRDFVLMSTPAIGADGSIYIISANAFSTPTSTLHKVAASGTLVWNIQLDEATTSSPKIFHDPAGDQVFVSTPGDLFIYDTFGTLLHHEVVPAVCPVVGSTPVSDFFDALVDFFSNIPVEFDTSAKVIGIPNSPYPTIAIVKHPNVTSVTQPIIVVPNLCEVTFYQWTDRGLEFLGRARSDEATGYTSPAVSAGGAAIISRGDGVVLAFGVDANTIPHVNLLWSYDTKEKVKFSAATSLRQVYVASTTKLHVLEETNGAQVVTYSLSGSDEFLTPPVRTADYVYVGSEAGFHTFEWDLTSSVLRGDLIPANYRSPTVAPDGTVYLVAEGNLFAYAAP